METTRRRLARVMWSLASRSPRSMRLDSSTSSSRVSSGVAAMPSRNCCRASSVGSGAVGGVSVSVVTAAKLRPQPKEQLNVCQEAPNELRGLRRSLQCGQVPGAVDHRALGPWDLAREPLRDVVEVPLVVLSHHHERAGRHRPEINSLQLDLLRVGLRLELEGMLL